MTILETKVATIGTIIEFLVRRGYLHIVKGEITNEDLEEVKQYIQKSEFKMTLASLLEDDIK